MNRRAFLTSVAGGWLASAVLPAEAALRGHRVGASQDVGHRLRDGKIPAPEGPPRKADIVIAGSGVAGLSAAWRLAPAGLDVLVLELEPFVGGTSTWGDDGAAPHPFGAHYLVAPNPEARSALRLLSDMGTVTGFDAAGRPRFDPKVLCHAPQERLFYRGAWQKGLLPEDLDEVDDADMARFGKLERELTHARGEDGRHAFDIPLARSSRDPKFLALDRISMSDWLDREGFRSPFVRWTVRYACLDDFGALPEDVSAWAGLHYFTARKLRSAELEGSRFLVWPEGNGRLVRALMQLGRPRVETGRLVASVEESERGVRLAVFDVATGTTQAIEARAAVLAVPGFVLRRMIPRAEHVPVRASSPWLVANLHVERPFDPNLAWDSVIYGAEGLGYVDASHQTTAPSDRTVLTYYRAYGEPDVRAARTRLAAAPWDALADDVLLDLAPAHPDFKREIERMDLMVWGHGMPRPRPGFLGERPLEPLAPIGRRIAWAHVDQAGMALFEEANAAGVAAAEYIAEAMEVDLGESWL